VDKRQGDRREALNEEVAAVENEADEGLQVRHRGLARVDLPGGRSRKAERGAGRDEAPRLVIFPQDALGDRADIAELGRVEAGATRECYRGTCARVGDDPKLLGLGVQGVEGHAQADRDALIEEGFFKPEDMAEKIDVMNRLRRVRPARLFEVVVVVELVEN